MTFTHEYNLDIPKTYLHIKNKLSSRRLSKVRALQTDRQTDTQTDANENIIESHSRVKISSSGNPLRFPLGSECNQQ